MYNAMMNWLAIVRDWTLPVVLTLLVSAAVLWSVRHAIPDEPATRVVRQLASIAVIATAAQEIGWRQRQIGYLDDIVATLEEN